MPNDCLSFPRPGSTASTRDSPISWWNSGIRTRSTDACRHPSREASTSDLPSSSHRSPTPPTCSVSLGARACGKKPSVSGRTGSSLLGLDAAGLARQILRQLGFTVPTAPVFSIGAALRDADRARSRLQLAGSADELTGSGMAAVDAVEQVLRFSVVTWCTHSRKDGWEQLVEESLGKTSRLSFGDWVHLFAAIPKRLAPESEIYDHAHRLLKKCRVARVPAAPRPSKESACSPRARTALDRRAHCPR